MCDSLLQYAWQPLEGAVPECELCQVFAVCRTITN